MADNEDFLWGEPLRLELLNVLKEWREKIPGNQFFTLQPLWVAILERHPEIRETELNLQIADEALNSLFQEELVLALEHDKIVCAQITPRGLEYLKEQEEKQMSPIIIGTIEGSIVNINSTLKNVIQSIGKANIQDEAAKKHLTDLVEQLNTELQKAKPPIMERADAVANHAERLINEGTKAQPNKEMIGDDAESLKKAAEKIANVMPTVLIIASGIVKTVLQLVG